ncbi:exosortase-dependent surface protein XDP1 [Azoarcus sp. L1K30]|uniref:exosortase-dependent surface protein XDP1 n=1 Tax=Azoarcus sp. L1K30 TaxID=2820277 RepID=UPI002011EE0E|nr:exosortase-dependent surface protein XDP1 [Azoarcus sp. L1K30]
MLRIFKMKKQTAIALLVSGLSVFSGSASAAWNWDLSCGTFACSQTTSASQTSTPTGGPAVTVTGWSGVNSGSSLAQGYIESWNGVGVQYSGESSASPNHAMDNNGQFESILLNFGGSSINLSSASLGWVYNNDARRSDFFVLAYTGAAPFNGSLAGKSYADLLTVGSGWTLIGNSGGSGAGAYGLASGSIYSSFWLIGAGAVSGTSVGYGSNNYYDYMKVASVGGSVKPPSTDNKVPEPGSLALAGLGLLGLIGASRRKVRD